jgi:ribosomal protein S10
MYLKFILKSNSNKELDALAKDIVMTIKKTGSVKSGPIPFKGERVIYCYNYNSKTISTLMTLKQSRKIKIEILSLEKSY